MRLNLDSAHGLNLIQAYRSGTVVINQREHTQSIIITADRIIDWPPENFSELAVEHFDSIRQLAPEFLILGTGERQQFPAPAIMKNLLSQGMGVEVMDTGAACRTFNIVMAEGRRVAAALLMI